MILQRDRDFYQFGKKDHRSQIAEVGVKHEGREGQGAGKAGAAIIRNARIRVGDHLVTFYL